jgi:hypothetical protein
MLTLLMSLACGGGGGGGTTGQNVLDLGDGVYTYVHQKHDGMSSGNSALVVQNLKVLSSFSNKDLAVAVKTGSTELFPELLLSLQGGQPSGGSLEGTFNAAIFGDQGDEKATIQTIVDFTNSGSPTITAQGMSASSSDFASELNELSQTVFTITSDGFTTWGDYRGVVTEDGDKFLLSHNSKAIFILASKRQSLLALASPKTLTGALLAQNLTHENNPLSSGEVDVTVEGSDLNITLDDDGLASTQDIDEITIPTRDFGYVADSGNSELEIYADGSTTDIREQGFMSDEFVVIVNPNTSQAPYIIIAPY